MNVLRIFQTNGEIFYRLFNEATENNVKAAKLLYQIYSGSKNSVNIGKKIHTLEHKGDEISHQIFSELNKSFMTPIDREDIIEIAHGLDDVIDFIYAAASDFDIYQIKKPTTYTKQFVSIIVESTEVIHKGLPKIRRRKTFKDVEKAIVEINRLENEADTLLKAGIKSLFINKKSPIDIIRYKSIYYTMEQAVDSCEHIANVLGGLTIKYA